MVKDTKFVFLPRKFLIILAMLSMPLQAAAPSWPSKRTEVSANVDLPRLLEAEAQPGEWFTGGRDYQHTYYSPLDRIKKSNIKNLGVAWSSDIDVISRSEATPIVVDGVMFTSGSKGAVYALDAGTGAKRWTFTPDVDLRVMSHICCGPVNRGVAVWRGKVFVASLDGYLYALNADTGAVVWRVDTIVDRTRAYAITGAPYIAKNRVVIGNSGADFDARGYVTAYDVDTGKQAWRFFTVPGDPQKGFEHPELGEAAKTWDPNSLWEGGLGGTAWDGMAYDPKLNMLYVGTGNATPFPRKIRSPSGGDNLFLASILALNPDTGRLIWHYQTVPKENWDYTATQKMILADLRIKGRMRQVLMQAPKNGFFYVLDRSSGELLSAKPYVHVNWATHVDLKTGRPVETGQGDYSTGPKLIFPSTHGGHNWQPMAYNLKTKLVYIPAIELPELFFMPEAPFRYKRQQGNRGVIHVPPTHFTDGRIQAMTKKWPSVAPLTSGQVVHRPRTYLRAWDPLRQRLVWEIETTSEGDPSDSSFDGAGVMTTGSGLVFHGRSVGDLDGRMDVVDAKNGALLRSIGIGAAVHAAPMSYAVAGEQYVAVMAGERNGGRIIAFKLGGNVSLKRAEAKQTATDAVPPPILPFGTQNQIELGRQVFERTCAVCHVDAARAPNLAKMSREAHEEFEDIVLKGRRAAKGMGNFSSVVSEDEAKAIHAYLTELAWNRYNNMH